MIKFNKGHIVPRWTGVKTKLRKAQHHIKFGCNVSYEGGIFFAESEGALLSIPIGRVHVKRKDGSLQKSIVIINNVHCNISRV